ncbi:hypothetical protein [Mucisphaera calidilacus]|uniref:Uncharacterized protein n=1 Tax=Mucisphaera calidilacus TaxID=2527982 RepID=A0A518BZS6_9BACT|nr:hypothetical protein [Mucisphaera calidilacus]QDU72478.1 hypothetical protein Pan265_23440 [Mucisphaera calidilacus]
MFLMLGQIFDQLNSDHLFALMMFAMVFFMVTVITGISQYFKVLRHREEAVIKARLIERGASAEEIERILRAGQDHDESRKKCGVGRN